MLAGTIRHPLLFIAVFAVAGPPLGGCLAAVALTLLHGGTGALSMLVAPSFYGFGAVFGFVLGFLPALATAGATLLVQHRSKRVTAFEIVAIGLLASAVLAAWLFGPTWTGVLVTIAGTLATALLWLIARLVCITEPYLGAVSPAFS